MILSGMVSSVDTEDPVAKLLEIISRQNIRIRELEMENARLESLMWEDIESAMADELEDFALESGCDESKLIIIDSISSH